MPIRNALIPRTICGLIEPAIRSVADRLFVLTGGREGSQRRRPRIDSFYETGLVVAIYEFLLMSPDLAHLEIRHENPYSASTRPEQVDLWIRNPHGGTEHTIECGDFSPHKLKSDAKKLRRLNSHGTKWFLGFFRDEPDSRDPRAKIAECRKRKGSLKGLHIRTDQNMMRTFEIRLPNHSVWFGYALIRVD